MCNLSVRGRGAPNTNVHGMTRRALTDLWEHGRYVRAPPDNRWFLKAQGLKTVRQQTVAFTMTDEELEDRSQVISRTNAGPAPSNASCVVYKALQLVNQAIDYGWLDNHEPTVSVGDERRPMAVRGPPPRPVTERGRVYPQRWDGVRGRPISHGDIGVAHPKHQGVVGVVSIGSKTMVLTASLGSSLDLAE